MNEFPEREKKKFKREGAYQLVIPSGFSREESASSLQISSSLRWSE